MTIQDALNVLEIERDVTPQQARRAYLRKVKRFKPERDPEGFRRVREAYDIVTPLLAVPPEARWFDEPEETPSEAADSPQPEPEAERLEVEQQAADPAQDAEDDVDEDYGPELFFPQNATPEQLDEGIERTYPRLMAAFEKARNGDPEHVVSGWLSLEVLAALSARGDWARACTLKTAIEIWQSELAALNERFSGSLAARWVLLAELVDRGPRLPSQVASTVGRTVLDDNPNIATIELAQYQRRDPQGASDALLQCKVSAPVLHALLAQHLKEITLPHFRPTGRRWVWGIAFLAYLLMKGVRVWTADVSPESAANEHGFDLQNIQRARDTLDRVATERHDDDLGRHSAEVYDAFVGGSCRKLQIAFRTLEGTTRETPPEIRDEVQRYWAEYLIMCPERPVGETPKQP